MSTLPLLPIGYPGESETAIASQQKALLLISVLLLFLGDVASDSGNDTFEFFLQVIVLIVGGVFCTANR